ncbi:MAG TPA: hypothetical protein VGE68_02065 [Sphingomicrobium sp.]
MRAAIWDGCPRATTDQAIVARAALLDHGIAWLLEQVEDVGCGIIARH